MCIYMYVYIYTHYFDYKAETKHFATFILLIQNKYRHIRHIKFINSTKKHHKGRTIILIQ